MPFSKKIQKEATPKRVYAFLKLVEYKEMTKDELEKYLQPKELNKGNNTPFTAVYSFVERANLIEIDKDFGESITLNNIESSDLKDWDSYRKFMAKLLLSNENSNFLKFTSWYLQQEKEVFNYSSSKEIQKHLSGDIDTLIEDDILGWRFWASFLGIGFLSGGIIIPNTYQRIRDVLEEDLSIKRDIEIPFEEFMQKILIKCKEFKSCINGNNINFGISNGLRTLHDQKLIQLIKTSDSTDIWHLYRTEHEILEDVTSIKINRW